MDTLFKNMDFSVKHWSPFPRRFPAPFPVVNFDFLDHKAHWMRERFSVCAFSLILRGKGEFKRLGKTWLVEAPCVITQWPGEMIEYGPTQPDGTWDELYVVYNASLMPALQRCCLLDLERPVWSIADLPAVNVQIEELTLLSKSPTPELVVDRVDRVCERLVLETCLAPRPAAKDEGAIHALLAKARLDFRKTVNLEREAVKKGMSASTFRRRWALINEVSPSRYLQQLKIREACRLLVETALPIHEIASEVGFDDEFYFSRRFHAQTQMAPRDYRKAYQTHGLRREPALR